MLVKVTDDKPGKNEHILEKMFDQIWSKACPVGASDEARESAMTVFFLGAEFAYYSTTMGSDPEGEPTREEVIEKIHASVAIGVELKEFNARFRARAAAQ